MSRTKTHLHFLKQIELKELIEQEFVSRNETDVAFAEYAAKKLKVAVTKSHVQGMRELLSIPATRTRTQNEKSNPYDAIWARLEEIERQLAAINKKLEL